MMQINFYTCVLRRFSPVRGYGRKTVKSDSPSTFASVLPQATGNTQLVEEGKTYYVLASSGVSFSDYIPTENTHIVKIIVAY